MHPTAMSLGDSEPAGDKASPPSLFALTGGKYKESMGTQPAASSLDNSKPARDGASSPALSLHSLVVSSRRAWIHGPKPLCPLCSLPPQVKFSSFSGETVCMQSPHQNWEAWEGWRGRVGGVLGGVPTLPAPPWLWACSHDSLLESRSLSFCSSLREMLYNVPSRVSFKFSFGTFLVQHCFKNNVLSAVNTWDIVTAIELIFLKKISHTKLLLQAMFTSCQ